MGEGFLGRFVDFFFARIEPPVLDVLENGVVKEKGLLIDDANLGAKRILRDLADFLPIEADCSFVRIVESEDQREKSAFARPALADQGVVFASFELSPGLSLPIWTVPRNRIKSWGSSQQVDNASCKPLSVMTQQNR